LNERVVDRGGLFFLKTFRITYGTLKNAVKIAHQAINNDTWTQSSCEIFLRVEGLHTKFIQQVLENAINCKAYRIAQNNNGRDNDELLRVLQAARDQDPKSFEMIEFPALWTRNGIELTTHVDSIMHLMFLGIVSTTIEKIQDWLTVQHKNATFLSKTSHYLLEFKNITIDWMPILQYTKGKLGAWVSENYLAFSRIMLWYFQNIGIVHQKIDDAPPDTLPQNKWLAKHNRYWLMCRGLNTEGKASELAARVGQFMKQNPVPPEIPKPEYLAEHVEDTLSALSNVLECVMASEVSDEVISKCSYAIRIFLSKFDIMDATIRTNDAKPTIVSAFNFSCLINLIDTMATYGPLRNLWEGGPRGEGFL
jgi:hypothetical protein